METQESYRKHGNLSREPLESTVLNIYNSLGEGNGSYYTLSNCHTMAIMRPPK